MRFLAVALLPRETPDVQLEVARLMAPYDLNTPAPPYKQYLSWEQLKVASARWNIPINDLQALVTAINERSVSSHVLHFQADMDGIYALIDTNPYGKYKRWSLNSLVDDVWPVSDMPRDLAPRAVITPDGQWHQLFPNVWGRLPTELDTQRIMRETYQLVDQYPDHLAARLECQV